MMRILPIILSFFLACAAPDTTPSENDKRAEALVAASSAETDTLLAQFDLNYVMGKFNPATHPDFTLINIEHADREGMYLRRDTYEAFKKMYRAALEDSVKLIIRSATRNFEAQKGIWEAKWTGVRKIENGENLALTTPDAKERALKILRYSSMPSTSRHHWGTDIDFNAFTNEFFKKGKGKKIYDWLTLNAASYGFCQPYSPIDEQRPNGYYEERWHWSYLPIAQPLTQLAATQLKDELITGFKGAEAATRIKVVENYVLGINEKCLSD